MEKDKKTILSEAAADQLNRGDIDEALKTLDQALDQFPDEAGFYFGKAVALGRCGAFCEALHAVTEALRLSPTHLKAKALHAELEQKLHTRPAADMDELQRLFDGALEALENEDGVQTLNCCHKAIALGIEARNLDYIRAMGFVLIGDYRFAQLSLEQELSRYPDNSEAEELLRQVNEELRAKG